MSGFFYILALINVLFALMNLANRAPGAAATTAGFALICFWIATLSL